SRSDTGSTAGSRSAVTDLPDVRWRGHEVSRLEAFSDCVFAFALTLLVVSLEGPKSFQDLLAAMRGFPLFAFCFAVVLCVWRAHSVFFRRYGLDDFPTMVLNSGLLLVVLFYVYPLKFAFDVVLAADDARVRDAAGRSVPPIAPGDWPQLMVLFGFG